MPSPLSGKPRLSSVAAPDSESTANTRKWTSEAALMVYLL
jgi:hypothetical protein